MRVVIAISGASGATLGMKTLRALPESFDKHLIVSEHAQVVLEKEHAIDFDADAPMGEGVTVHKNREIWASVASGSFKCDAMLVVLCSMNTLAKISVGIADNLITRAASVMIKEHRTLLLAPREMPFSAIALENMQKLAALGVFIAPPVLAYYSEQNSLDEMENFMIGKWFDLVGIDNDLYKRWK
jgi:4-hydroxy-3-polyprenylbenzoate decarboxylase